MKSWYLVVSALCALTTGASSAMHQALVAPSGVDALMACVDMKDLLFELGAVLYKGKLDKKALSHLSSCFHKDTIARLFTASPEAFDRFIDTESLSEFCRLVFEKAHDQSSTSKKVRALKNIFQVEAWEEELECQGLGPVLSNMSKLIYFSGSAEERKDLLQKLKRAVSALLPQNNQPRKIDQYIDIQKLHALVDDLINNKVVLDAHIISIIKVNPLQERLSSQPNSLASCIHLKNLLLCIITLLRADQAQEDFSYTTLLQCLRWDGIFINLPEILGQSPKALQVFFSLEKLREQIALLQDGTELTADGLRAILHREAFESVGISQEQVESCINFELLATGLNALRKGEQSHELREAFNFSCFERALGVDIASALNTELPPSVQAQKFAELIDHLHKPQWIVVIGSASTMLWLASNMVCHSCVDALTPRGWIAGIGLAVSLYAVYKGTQLVEHTKPLSVGLINSLPVKAQAVLARLLPMKPVHQQELLRYAPQNNDLKPVYVAFVQLLTDDHLGTLKKPIDMINLFEKPRAFVIKNPEFIESMCVDDKERSSDRIAIVEQLLESVVPFDRLPHKEAITTFFDLLNRETLLTLPHTGLFLIGRYCPKILQKYHAFMMKASEFISGDKPVIWYFHKAIADAEGITKVDLEQ